MDQLSKSAIITLSEIKDSKNPTEYLSNRFDCCASDQKDELRSVIRELTRTGCIQVMWADNSPWHVDVDNTLIDAIIKESSEMPREEENSISIGNNNKIVKSIISSGSVQLNCSSNKKTFSERHPVIISAIITLVVGFFLMFSFWERIIAFIENLF